MRDTPRQRATLWAYTLRYPGGPSVNYQRDTLYQWINQRRAVYLQTHRLVDWCMPVPEAKPGEANASCLSCNLVVRLRRNDQVAICHEVFSDLAPYAQLALLRMCELCHATLWVVGPEGQASNPGRFRAPNAAGHAS